MNTKFECTINDFSGPLDLLLHLIKESKKDIYEVPIEQITEEYISFIEAMEEINIDVASEYLVLASELIHLKSKKLLNIRDNEEDGEQLEFKIGTEEELRHRLLEYKKYKEVTEDLKVLESKRCEVYTKLPEALEEYRQEVKLSSDITLDDLIKAFNEFLERQKYSKPLNTKITKKEISVEERSHEIREILKRYRRVDFFELFEVLTKEYVVVTFLSILEMTKSKEVNIKQEQNFSNIIIEAM